MNNIFVESWAEVDIETKTSASVIFNNVFKVISHPNLNIYKIKLNYNRMNMQNKSMLDIPNVNKQSAKVEKQPSLYYLSNQYPY